jgi:hypothetical protein
MGGLLFLMAMLAMVVGCFQWAAAFRQVEPVIPDQFKENWSTGYAFLTYVWSNLVPASARRRFLRCLVLSAMALALMGGTVFLQGQTFGAVLFAAASAYNAAAALWLWIKHRDQL